MRRNCLILILPALIVLGCNHHKTELDIEKALKGLTKKYPQLPTIKGNQIEYYTLERKLIIGNNDLELQLRRQADKTGSAAERIIVVINSQKHVYAIPFMSNKYRDYWKLSISEDDKKTPPFGTTFEKELRQCCEELGFKGFDMLNLFKELFYSLLHCQNDCNSKIEDIIIADSNNLRIYHLKEFNGKSYKIEVELIPPPLNL